MQHLSFGQVYALVMPTHHAAKIRSSRLKALREAAGLSQRELAKQIGVIYSNVGYWESSGNLPRSDVLIPIAKALGVTVEELLGEPKLRRAMAPGGKLRQVFEAASHLPRRQQQKVVEFVGAFVERQSNGHKQAA